MAGTLLDLPTEAFGAPLNAGPLPKTIQARLEKRWKDRFCPFLMARCPRPYPICSLSVSGVRIPICPHRVLEDQAIFRSLTSSTPSRRWTLLRHVHPARESPILAWVLFDAYRPDLWVGVNTMTPLPAEESALALATHDLSQHGKLREEGYDLSFDWPASAADGYRWLAHLAEWAHPWGRPVFVFVPTPLFERLRSLGDLKGDDLSPVLLIPVVLGDGPSDSRLRVAAPAAPKPAPADRGEVWKTILRRWSDWISLEALGRIAMTDL